MLLVSVMLEPIVVIESPAPVVEAVGVVIAVVAPIFHEPVVVYFTQ